MHVNTDMEVFPCTTWETNGENKDYSFIHSLCFQPRICLVLLDYLEAAVKSLNIDLSKMLSVYDKIISWILIAALNVSTKLSLSISDSTGSRGMSIGRS